MARMGRPPLYNNCLDFAGMVEMYFEECEKPKERTWVNKRGDVQKAELPSPPLMETMAEFLGMDGSTLRRYGEKEDFHTVFMRAKQRIAAELMEGALSGRYEARTVQFNLAANDGDHYNIKQQVETTTKIDLSNRLYNALSVAQALPTGQPPEALPAPAEALPGGDEELGGNEGA